MSYSPRSNNPDAPRIPGREYIFEKTDFAGSCIASIAYGIVIALFFQCMSVLLNPSNHGKWGIRWLFVLHTVVMFLLVTAFTAMYLGLKSIAYIDMRAFPGNDSLPPGYTGYQHLVFSKAISLIPRILFMLNNWLADGLLLYRCFLIYAMNYWAVAFPGLMYLGSLAMGTLLIYYQTVRPECTAWGSGTVNIGTPYYSVSVALNVVITAMIIARLALHNRQLQDAVGPSLRRSDGFYDSVVSMLIESSALYAVTFVLFIIPWAINNPAEFIFYPFLAQTQVIAPFFITLRVAKRRLLSRDTTSWDVDPASFEGGSSVGDGVMTDNEKASATRR